MGHSGEIRLADPVFSAVVLPTNSNTWPHWNLDTQSRHINNVYGQYEHYIY